MKELENHPPLKRFVRLSLFVFILDQLTKFWAVGHLTYAFFATDGSYLGFWQRLQHFLWYKHPLSKQAIAVFPYFWHFRYVENPGAAWGFLSRTNFAWRTPFFLMISLIAMVFIITYTRRLDGRRQLLHRALSLVMGGALGNFCDRLRLGYVVDFIDWHYFEFATWPTFNVADAAISVGVVLMLIESYFPVPQPARRLQRGVTYVP